MLHIHLLGIPRILDDDTDDDEPLSPLAPPKTLSLLAYLLLKRQHPLSRDQLAYTLWPDTTEAEARANLRRHLHLLQRQLPASPGASPWILATRHTLQWNPRAPCWLDVALLEDFDPTAADEARWDAVLGCYGGELLSGCYDDWLLPERERLHLRYVHLLEQRIARQQARGDLPGALAAAQRLLRHEPLREESYRHLMALHYATGDRAAALQAFEKCQAMLETELGVDPMPETLALREAIQKGDDVAAYLPPADRPALLEPQTEPAEPLAAEPPAPAHTRPVPAAQGRSRPPRSTFRARTGVLLAVTLLAAIVLLVLRLRPGRKIATVSISGPDTVQDTWLSEMTPDLPYDAEWSHDPFAIYPQIHLQYFSYPMDRVLVRFNLQQLPADAEVERAVFRLHTSPFITEDIPTPLPATVSVFRILRPWQENTVTFNSPWSQPGLAPGVDYDEQPLGSQPIDDMGWIAVDVTEAARAWLFDPGENWGLLVMISEAPRGAHYWVDTTEYLLTSRHPVLEVTYWH